MGKRNLTDEQIDRICELRESGFSYPYIARRIIGEFGVAASESSIAWWCLRRGADLPPDRRPPVVINLTPRARGNHMVRPFTPDEDTLLRVLDMQGFGPSVIARRLNRKHNSVIGRLATLARQDARREEVELS